jgi:membrane-associated protease RseP (regulator of RpoE activity)
LLAFALFTCSSICAGHVLAADNATLAAAQVEPADKHAPAVDLGAVIDVRQAGEDGARVLAVTPGGVAASAGLRAGDLLKVINGQRLTRPGDAAGMLSAALRADVANLDMEVVRDGKALRLSGKAKSSSGLAMGSCGYVSDQQGVVPRGDDVFRVEITQVEGLSTPTTPTNRHRVAAGRRVIVVRELIPATRLTTSQNVQIARMKKFAFSRSYKAVVIDIAPGTSYRIGARLLRDRLDADSIRANAYWQPVVWAEAAETCP